MRFKPPANFTFASDVGTLPTVYQKPPWMTLEIDKRWYQDSDIPDSVKVYATRLARLFFLRHSCSDDDHPVLDTERQLIEIARSRLQETLLRAFSIEEVVSNRPYIVWWIKSIARIRASSHIDGKEARNAVTSSIDNEELDDLFEFHGH